MSIKVREFNENDIQAANEIWNEVVEDGNASYAVKSTQRGKHIGEILVTYSLKKAKEIGYGVLQFNAVVATNQYALKLYKKLGFVQLGVIPKGFRMKDGTYEDIIPHYHTL